MYNLFCNFHLKIEYNFIAYFSSVILFKIKPKLSKSNQPLPPGYSGGKEFVWNVGNLGLIPKLGRSSGWGHGHHCSILAWKIPWTEEPGRLEDTGSQRVGHNWEIKHTCTLEHKHWDTVTVDLITQMATKWLAWLIGDSCDSWMKGGVCLGWDGAGRHKISSCYSERHTI